MKIRVCGVAFDNLTVEEAVREALRGEEGEPCAVVTPNALMLEACKGNQSYTELLNAASLILPDGNGVLLAAKRQGTPFKERVTGIDFGHRLLQEGARRGLRVFLLGGRDGVAPRAAQHLQEEIPGIRICGSYWGYFDREGEENLRVLGMIRACRPDLLAVCLGFPHQELWMRENLHCLPSVRVAMGLGGSLDVWSGDRRRAPASWQNHGMEWAWRMLQEPSRIKELPSLLRFARG